MEPFKSLSIRTTATGDDSAPVPAVVGTAISEGRNGMNFQAGMRTGCAAHNINYVADAESHHGFHCFYGIHYAAAAYRQQSLHTHFSAPADAVINDGRLGVDFTLS